jgi:hypothetical protein
MVGYLPPVFRSGLADRGRRRHPLVMQDDGNHQCSSNTKPKKGHKTLGGLVAVWDPPDRLRPQQLVACQAHGAP